LKSTTLFAVFITAIFFFTNPGSGKAQLLTEDFDFPAGALLTSNGWNAHNAAGSQAITVDAGGLSYPGYVMSGIGNAALLDNNGEDVNRTFTAQASGPVYVAFMARMPVFSTGYFLHLGGNPIGTTYRARVFGDVSGSLGLSFGSGTATLAPGTISASATYLLVLKYQVVAGTNNDQVSLFIFESGIPATEPSTPTIGPLTDAALTDITPASIALRQYVSTQNYLVDGIRVATSWADAIGTQVVAPLVQASNLSFSNINGNSMTLSWVKGDGEKRLLKMSTSLPLSAPVDGTDPAASSVYQGNGEQVMYNGSDTTVTVTGLASNTSYSFQVFEYNGTGSNTKYCTASGSNNPLSQSTLFVPTIPQVTIAGVSAISTNSATLSANIISDGGSPVLERGTVWSINTPVTINDNLLAEGGTNTGSFSQVRLNLPPGTEIFYAAYATNAIGTALSQESGFFTLAHEPSAQATAFQAPYAPQTSITVSWNDNPGTQPAHGFLIKSNTTGVFTAPQDGIPETDDTLLADGSGAINVGTGVNLYTWTALIPSTTYYFAIYPYTNSGPLIDYKTTGNVPVAQAATDAVPVYLYTWQGENNADWNVPSNWNPARTNPDVTDILQFNDGSIKTVTGIPTQTIGKLLVSGNTKITLQATAAAILTLAGQDGTDLEVQPGSELNISGASSIQLALSVAASGTISGSMKFAGGAHRLTAASTTGLVFDSGSVFTASTGFSGNPFGTAAPYNAIVFGNGSTYVCQAGSNPFGATAPNSVVTFQQGSLFRLLSSITPSFSGRTYGDVEINVPGGTITPSGTNAVLIDNLSILAGTLNFNLSGNPGHSIKGNIYVATGASLNFSPVAAATYQLNGNSLQTISGGGSFILNTLSALSINNVNGIVLNTNLVIRGSLDLQNGVLALNDGNLLMGPAATVTGSPSVNSMVVTNGTGEFRKEFAGAGSSFSFPVGDNSNSLQFTPVSLSFAAGTFNTDNYAGIRVVNEAYPGMPLPASYLNRYWTISSSGINGFSCDAVFSYAYPEDVTGNESELFCTRVFPEPLEVYAPANISLHQLAAGGLSSFGTFTGMLPAKTIHLSMFLEGLYNGGGTMVKAQNASGDQFPGNTADQVRFELHDASAGNYSNLLYSSGYVDLLTNGSVTASIPATFNGSYYITVRHRNSIATVSANPVSFASAEIAYDFTQNAAAAFGANLKPSGDGKWLVYGGDVNQDYIVDSGDMIPLDNDGSGFVTGYVETDINGDGLVDLSDMITVDNNTGNFIAAITP